MMPLWRARAASSSLLLNSLRLHHASRRPAASSSSSVFIANDTTIASPNADSCFRSFSTIIDVVDTESFLKNMTRQVLHLDLSSQIGSCMPLGAMRSGTIINNIEMRPGQGGKLVRAPGTGAKILKEPTAQYCLLQLPSGRKKKIDSKCRATIGMVPDPNNGPRKLRKAGQSRWLGIRPKVRGVAMNPIDHPHGGGEGRSKSSGSHGRMSVSAWGKPTKCKWKTRPLRKRKLDKLDPEIYEKPKETRKNLKKKDKRKDKKTIKADKIEKKRKQEEKERNKI